MSRMITVEVFVIEQTESGKAIKCSVEDDHSNHFYLSKSQIKPHGSVRKGEIAKFDIPEWMFKNHRQLCGDQVFEENKRYKEQRDLRR